MRSHTLCAAAAIALCGGLIAPAGAAAVPAKSSMVIQVRDAGANRDHETWTLRCEPAGGTHGNAERACAALAEVNGNFAALTPLNEVCTTIYQPVAVIVRGHWRKRPVSFSATYGNRCVAGAESGGVFKFRRGYWSM